MRENFYTNTTALYNPSHQAIPAGIAINKSLLEYNPVKVRPCQFEMKKMIKVTINFLCCFILFSSTACAEGTYVSANGLKMYYEEFGKGEALVLLHGGSLTSGSWKWLIPEASKH